MLPVQNPSLPHLKQNLALSQSKSIPCSGNSCQSGQCEMKGDNGFRQKQMQHPSRDNIVHDDGFACLPEVVSTRLTQIHGIDEGKEVSMAQNPVPESKFTVLQTPEAADAHEYPVATKATSRKNQRSRKWILWLTAVIGVVVALAIGLGVGLGVGINHTKSSTPNTSSANGTAQPLSSSLPSQHIFSTWGPFNGTGIAVMAIGETSNISTGEKDPVNEGNGVLLFYQHYNGEIRWMTNNWPNSSFRGGSVYDTVATDARNSTPISCSGSQMPGRFIYQVFYVNGDNKLSQRSMDNLTYTWSNGPINDLEIGVLDSDRIGLLANFYAGPISNVDLSGTVPLSGLRLWVATDETSFTQYAWRYPLPQWIHETDWSNKNGHANPATYGWHVGTTTYVWFIDEQNTIELWWVDTSSEVLNTESHPLNVWTQGKFRPSLFTMTSLLEASYTEQASIQQQTDFTKAAISIPNVDPSAGLFFHSNLYGKVDDSGLLRGWNMSFAAENSSLEATNLSAPNTNPVALNTRLSSWSWLDQSGTPDQILVWCQTPDNNITMFTGDPSSGSWTSLVLAIPDE